MTERDDVLALDPLQMLLDAARFIERDKPQWAKTARNAVALRRAAAPAPTGDVRLADLIREYARDLRRNSSGGDDYPWEWAKATADYLEVLIERAALAPLPAGNTSSDGGVEAYRHAVSNETPAGATSGSVGLATDPSDNLPAGDMDKPTSPLPLPSEQRPSTEPVAWQARDKVHGGVWLNVPANRGNLNFEYRPLYAHPPADRDAVAEEREACAKICDEIASDAAAPTASGDVREALDAISVLAITDTKEWHSKEQLQSEFKAIVAKAALSAAPVEREEPKLAVIGSAEHALSYRVIGKQEAALGDYENLSRKGDS